MIHISNYKFKPSASALAIHGGIMIRKGFESKGVINISGIIKQAEVEHSRQLGIIHSESLKKAYKGIIPDDHLQGFTPEKRERRFIKALSELEKCVEVVMPPVEKDGIDTHDDGIGITIGGIAPRRFWISFEERRTRFAISSHPSIIPERYLGPRKGLEDPGIAHVVDHREPTHNEFKQAALVIQGLDAGNVARTSFLEQASDIERSLDR